MNTAFSRAVVVFAVALLGLAALPGRALASTKASPKHSHSHSHSVAKKELAPKKSKHHARKSTGSKGIASAGGKPPLPAKATPAAAPPAAFAAAPAEPLKMP